MKKRVRNRNNLLIENKVAAAGIFFSQRQILFPVPHIQRIIFNHRRFRQYFFQELLFLCGQIIKVNAKLAENHLPDFCKVIAREAEGILDFFCHLFCKGKIRRAVNVVFVGFANVMKDSVPCFVRDMAEKIFFLYLPGP